jgi:NAD(P)-dependent dehydrogenase (short-subunit alcohol dehydrogenase family)
VVLFETHACYLEERQLGCELTVHVLEQQRHHGGAGLALAEIGWACGSLTVVFRDRFGKSDVQHRAGLRAVAGDVRRAEDLERFVESSLARWGRIDGLANNAGELAAGAFAEHDDTVWEEDLALKLMGAVRLTRLALPALRESHGAVLNTLAVSGKAPDALTTPTSVSRAAGLALTKALSRELAPEGIRVNAVLIGVIESGQLRRYAAEAGITPEQYYERMVASSRIPLGRVGHPEEFADLGSFLLSPRASYITGAAVNLDGGLCPVV